MRAAGRLCLLVLLALPLPLPMAAKVPASPAEITLSFAPVVKAAAPAVVSIFASRVVAERISPFANDPFFSQFFDFGPGFGTKPRVENALGSGVILRGDGIVVTNNHVIDGAEDIRVVLADGREFAGNVILSDAGTDLAVIRLDGAEDLPALPLADADLAEVGDLVLAIGNPFGVGQTVTSGIVSALARAGGDPARGQGYFIQTDAPINPGNSGGALVDTEGRLLGINTLILSRSGGSNGIGFAIPSNLVGQYVAQAEAGAARFARPWSGIEVQRVDADMAEALDLDTPEGAVISHLHPDSPFARAGFRTGDVVTGIGGHAVNGPAELDYRLAVLGPDGTATVQYRRGGREEIADVALAAAPETGGNLTVGPGSRLSGLTVAALGPGLIDQLGLPLSATGVVVTGVAGPARATNLRPGDIVVGINGTAIRDLADFDAATRGGGRTWTVEFIRGGQRVRLRLSGG
ncbi:trypsin-like peptidase domain-containing protein [Defluviimonas sp. SAOS-178_SWC]|uniref:trypsin-like peptidase domain-containing protein n=1 Tax=Defluviimonas sp. SAOS-178_SWC TaxID=3121287 RepID=UPI0032218541